MSLDGAAENAFKKSSGHLPFPSCIADIFGRVGLEGGDANAASTAAPFDRLAALALALLSSASSGTLMRSAEAVSLGRLSLGGRCCAASKLLRLAISSATVFASAWLNDGFSEGTYDVASVVIVRSVPNRLFCDSLFRRLRTSNKLDIAVVVSSVVWLDANDCRIGDDDSVGVVGVDSANDARIESPTDARVESATDVRSVTIRGRNGERGGGVGL